MAKHDNDDIARMSDEDLMSEWTRLSEVLETGKERARAFSQEHQKRNRLAQLNLQPGDLELLQSSGPAGIPSEEAVN